MIKIFYIFIFTVGINFSSFAQNRLTPSSAPTVRFIKFYPNPATNFIYFEFDQSYNNSFSFQVYNFIGKKILDYKAVTPKMNIPLANFYRGVYIYQLRDKSGKVIESGKFQVRK